MVAIVVHGGAAKAPPTVVEPKLDQLRRSAKTGFIQLLAKQHEQTAALDAVQEAVKFMEDSPYFNAGYGSSLTSTGHVEMDAIIADGKTLNFGAVASVTQFTNPVLIARQVLDYSEHCLFISEGAHKLALQHGLHPIANRLLVSDLAKQRLAEYKAFKNAIDIDRIAEDNVSQTIDHDTVGSVAIDSFGNLASATSTGGITGKLPGRIGDTPVIGSGAYADNESGAVSTTGHGEAIMRVCLAREVLYRYERIKLMNDQTGTNPMEQAVKQSLDLMQTRVQGYGGVIALTAKHNGEDIAVGFNTVAMPWAYITDKDNDIVSICEQLNGQWHLIDSVQLNIHYGYSPNEHRTILE